MDNNWSQNSVITLLFSWGIMSHASFVCHNRMRSLPPYAQCFGLWQGLQSTNHGPIPPTCPLSLWHYTYIQHVCVHTCLSPLYIMHLLPSSRWSDTGLGHCCWEKQQVAPHCSVLGVKSSTFFRHLNARVNQPLTFIVTWEGKSKAEASLPFFSCLPECLWGGGAALHGCSVPEKLTALPSSGKTASRVAESIFQLKIFSYVQNVDIITHSNPPYKQDSMMWLWQLKMWQLLKVW